jgi:hypothetical protein
MYPLLLKAFGSRPEAFRVSERLAFSAVRTDAMRKTTCRQNPLTAENPTFRKTTFNVKNWDRVECLERATRRK